MALALNSKSPIGIRSAAIQEAGAEYLEVAVY
jgi:hypothetical protein